MPTLPQAPSGLCHGVVVGIQERAVSGSFVRRWGAGGVWTGCPRANVGSGELEGIGRL